MILNNNLKELVLENNQEKDLATTSDFSEDFKDFEDEGEQLTPELDEDIASMDMEAQIDALQEKIANENQETLQEQPEEQNEVQEEQNEEPKIKSPWDMEDEENAAVKKYIFYVSKDFTSIIDSLTTDERSAYINDAIQKKIDIEEQERKQETSKKIATHLVLMILVFIFATPFVLWLSHKAIMLTFDNYKYSQENFEKLYKERFSKDKAYMRSIQYNKEKELKSKKH